MISDNIKEHTNEKSFVIEPLLAIHPETAIQTDRMRNAKLQETLTKFDQDDRQNSTTENETVTSNLNQSIVKGPRYPSEFHQTSRDRQKSLPKSDILSDEGLKKDGNTFSRTGAEFARKTQKKDKRFYKEEIRQLNKSSIPDIHKYKNKDFENYIESNITQSRRNKRQSRDTQGYLTQSQTPTQGRSSMVEKDQLLAARKARVLQNASVDFTKGKEKQERHFNRQI